MPLSGQYSYRVKDGLKTAKGTPRKQVNLTDSSMVNRVYEQNLFPGSNSLEAWVPWWHSEPQFMPQAYNESSGCVTTTAVGTDEIPKQLRTVDTAEWKFFQTRVVPQRREKEENGSYAGYCTMSIVEKV